MSNFDIFSIIYLSILAILSYYDIKNNKNVPDFLVWFMYGIGIYQAFITDSLVYIVIYTLLAYLLYKLNVFGDAEVLILPVLAIHLNIYFIDVLIISSILAISVSYSISYTIFVLIVMFLNPFFSILLSYLGIILFKDKLYEIKKVDYNLIGEVTIDGKLIDKEYVYNNLGKQVIIKKTLPFLPILLVALVLVIYTKISFLKLLLPHI